MRRLLLIFFTISLLPFVNIPLATAQFSEAGVQEFRVPVDAPDFTLKELEGGNISLRELRGKIVILNFFTTW